MNQNHIEKKKEYIKLKYEYLSKVKYCEDEIKKLDKIIIHNCNHEWIRERDEGQYGKLWTYCKKCKVDSYSGFIHN